MGRLKRAGQWFASGPGRLFLVAWLAWAAGRLFMIHRPEADFWFLRPLRGNQTSEWLLSGLLLPPVALRLGAWVAGGFSPRFALAPLPWRWIGGSALVLALGLGAALFYDHTHEQPTASQFRARLTPMPDDNEPAPDEDLAPQHVSVHQALRAGK